MLHWTPARTAASSVTPIGAMLASPAPAFANPGAARSDHARMLAHAAKRRQAACGEDGAYWKACAPAAVAKAAAIRASLAFAPLP